jgi:hypothetical protein
MAGTIDLIDIGHDGCGAQKLDSPENEASGRVLGAGLLLPAGHALGARGTDFWATRERPGPQRASRGHTSSEQREFPQVAEPVSGCAIEAVFVVKAAEDRC